MKAIHIIGYQHAIYTDVPVPAPKPNELLVHVHRAGICHSDVEVLRQELGIYRSGGASLPIIPGHERAGEGVEVGEEEKGFQIGDSVNGQSGRGEGT